jgi:hypothetical protein
MVSAGGASFIQIDGVPADSAGTVADSLIPPAPVSSPEIGGQNTSPSGNVGISITY